MLGNVFLSVVITSVIGAFFTLALFLLKPITRKHFSPSWNYYIWVCVLVVMMLPLRITLPEKTLDTHITVNTEVSDVLNAEVVQTPFDNGSEQQETNPALNNVGADYRQARQPIVISRFISIVSYVWISFAAVIFALKLVKYFLFIKHTRKTSYPVDVPQIKEKRVSARISSTISSPLMTGVLKPVLLLPDITLTEEQINNVVLHEMIHYKRCDMLVKWFSIAAKSIHFFNPAVYFVCKQLDEECEISCDAAVVKNMTKENEMSYVNTIISLLSNNISKHMPLTTGMAGSKETLKKRFLLIKNKKHISKKVIFVSVAVAVLLVAIALLSGGILNGSIIKGEDDDVIHYEGAPGVFKDVYSECVGYIENAETDFIKVYTEKNGEYVMSIPWAVVEAFPANNRKAENYTFGWMDHMRIFCGEKDDFHWAVVATNGVMNKSHIGVCTSNDGGKNWYVDNTNAISKGIVDNAVFYSEKVGYIFYSGGGYGKGVSKTTDGGSTWEHKMEYDMPLPLSDEDALRLLKYQLITAYEATYGEYTPRYDDPGSMAGDKERLPYIIEILRITKDDGEYYTVPVIWDFLIEKETGRIYKFYDGLDKMLIPFDPLDENALSFAG